MSTTTSAPRRLFGKSGGPGRAETPKKSGGGKRLSREDRRQIEAAIARTKRTDKKELSAQDSIPYQRMYPDGICRVTDTFFTKTVQFQDINYQLSQNEDKTAIFEGWSDFLNYFDSSIRFQLSFLNLSAAQDGSRTVVISLKGDSFDGERAEYSEMLQNQLAKGKSGALAVGEHKLRRLVGVKLDNALGLVNDIAGTLYLRHDVCASGQLGKVDLAVLVGGKFLRAKAAVHSFNGELDVGNGLGEIGRIHLDKMDTGQTVIEKDKFQDAVSSLQFDLLGRGRMVNPCFTAKSRQIFR